MADPEAVSSSTREIRAIPRTRAKSVPLDPLSILPQNKVKNVAASAEDLVNHLKRLEILSRIFAELPPLLLTEKARLCLVCKDLLPIARGHLYGNNCFIPTLFGSFYAAGKTFRPFLTGKESKSTAQRSILFINALRSVASGRVNLGKVSLDFSQPELAAAWPSFKLSIIHNLLQLDRFVLSGLWCLLPPVWIQADFLEPFLQCTKSVEIILQSSAIKSDVDPKGHKLSFRPSLNSTSGNTGAGKLYARLESFVCKNGRYNWPESSGEVIVGVIGEWETMVTVLGACAQRITDVVFAYNDFKYGGAYVLWRCHKLQTLRIHDEPYRETKKNPDVVAINDIKRRTWASTSITSLHLALNTAAKPNVAMSYVYAVADRVVGLKKVRIGWEKSEKLADRSKLGVEAWTTIDSFCSGNAERREADKKLENKKQGCVLETVLVKVP